MISLILISSLIPIIVGIATYFIRKQSKALSSLLVVIPVALSSIINTYLFVSNTRGIAELFNITKDIRLVFNVDTIGCFFSIIFSIAFLLVGIFSISYFENDKQKNHFDCFFLISFGALVLLCFSGNLLTMYFNFEAVTLCSMPLVLHDKTKESIDAALKYLLYSVGGAFLGFIGVVYIQMNCTTDIFALGGILKDGVANTTSFQVILLLMLIGFGAKCGLFPLHNWLPTAHPVAPAPASSLLSGIITKSGIIAIIRIIFFAIGENALRGSWVQTTWIILILLTILLGSFMAAIQNNFKKRLAFSTVSQVSYILLGIATLNGDGLNGSLLQICSHASIKICLFLVAGVLIHVLGIHDVDEMEGVGKKMPVTMWCYTICSLGLIGVPPTSGFTAKWYLATGALNSGLGAISVIAPIILIISAILTAYYLLSCTIKAFFPSNKDVKYEKVKEPLLMVIPLIVLAILTLVIGIIPSPILSISFLN